MPEVKSLSDFYDPTRTMQMGLQYMQGQQHLAMQAQGLANQQQSVAQQGKNLEIDNLQKALATANPMESYPIVKQLHEKLGLEPPAVNAYYANTQMYDKLINASPGTPEHDEAMGAWQKTSAGSRAVVKGTVDDLRAFRGAQELNIKAGIGGSEDLASLTEQKPALQTQVGQAAASTQMEQAKAKMLQAQIQEHENVAANVNVQIGALLPISKAADLAIQRTTPHVEALAAIQDTYDKNLKGAGLTKAAAMRNEQIALNPDLKAFNDRRQQSIEPLQQQVQKIEDMQAQLQTRAELIANGVEPLKEGESLHVLAGKIDASVKHLDFAKAQLAFAKDASPANLDALRAVKAGMDTHIATLTERKNASSDALDIRRDAQQETARKNRQGEAYTNAVAEGQAQFGVLPPERQSTAAAARIARAVEKSTGVKVKAEDILIKDPNRPGVQVNLTEEKAESKTVGTGLGEQYLETQKAGRAAMGMMNKLDRMDTLLAGSTTGKLTPSLTEIQALGEAIGFKVDPSLGAKQAFTALSAEMALQLRNPAGGAGMPGAMSDKDREFLQSMTPSLAQTNEGNKLIIDTARQVARRDQQIAKMARDYRKTNGHLDEGFFDEVQAYAEKNPLFKGKTAAAKPLLTPSELTAPLYDPEKERRYQEYKRKNLK